MERAEQRLRELEGWRRDVAVELRELEAWVEDVSPFLETLRVDAAYHARRHAEAVKQWGTGAKLLAGLGTFLVVLVTVGGFVLQVIMLSRGAGGP